MVNQNIKIGVYTPEKNLYLKKGVKINFIQSKECKSLFDCVIDDTIIGIIRYVKKDEIPNKDFTLKLKKTTHPDKDNIIWMVGKKEQY